MGDDPVGLTGGQRIGRVEDRVTDHSRRINDLEDWRAETRGAASMLRALFGVSVLNALGVAVTIWLALHQ